MASPPNIRVFWIFCCGVVTGMKITPFLPKCRHMKATPCAWLPAEAATNRLCSGRLRMALKAPRNL